MLLGEWIWSLVKTTTEKLGDSVRAWFFRSYQLHSHGNQEHGRAEVTHTVSLVFNLLISIKNKDSFAYLVEILWVTLSVFMKLWMHKSPCWFMNARLKEDLFLNLQPLLICRNQCFHVDPDFLCHCNYKDKCTLKDFIIFPASKRILPSKYKVQTAKLIAIWLLELSFSCVICLVTQSKWLFKVSIFTFVHFVCFKKYILLFHLDIVHDYPIDYFCYCL